MKKLNNCGYATTHKTINNYGQRGWRSGDGLFNEADLRSCAVAYRDIPGGKEEFSSFYQQKIGVPTEVLERVWKHVNG